MSTPAAATGRPIQTAGEALVQRLEQYGVDTVFGIPGVHTLELYRGLHGSSIRHVLPRHEQGAGFMADGYARSSGRVGVCFVISGPGVTNVATAIGQAYADSVPLLVISSVNTSESLGRGWGCLHECKDQSLLTRSITAFSEVAHSAAELPGLIDRAFAVFAAERPRPVHLSIPLDVLAAPLEQPWPAPAALPARTAAANAGLAEAVALIARCARPIVIAGGGAVDAAEELGRFARLLGAPVFTTVAGKGLTAPGDAWGAGATLCTEQGWAEVERAGLVVAVGTEMAETDFWRERLPIRGELLRIDIDPAKLHDRYSCSVGLVGDARLTLQALTARLEAAAFAPQGNSASASSAGLAACIEQSLPPLQQLHRRVLKAIEDECPADTIFASDMTQIAYSANYLMPGPAAPRRWLHPTGFGTLGYGLPAGIGAQIAHPQAPVLVLAGDGGLLYTASELATAQEEMRGSLVLVVWNNQALGQIRDDMVERGIEPVGVLPRAPDFVLLAQAHGCHACRPRDFAEFRQALREAWPRPGLTLIEWTPEAAGRPVAPT